MRPKRSRARQGTPIDAKKQELLDRQEELNARMKKLEALIEDAPRIQEQVQKRRREELSSLSSRGQRRVDAPRSIEQRYAATTTFSHAPHRSLKAEKRQMQLKFFVLCLVFILALICLYHAMR